MTFFLAVHSQISLSYNNIKQISHTLLFSDAMFCIVSYGIVYKMMWSAIGVCKTVIKYALWIFNL